MVDSTPLFGKHGESVDGNILEHSNNNSVRFDEHGRREQLDRSGGFGREHIFDRNDGFDSDDRFHRNAGLDGEYGLDCYNLDDDFIEHV
jgi:hypothetical protein